MQRTALAVIAALATQTAVALPCRVRADGPAPLVVQLYTSEGCSSCPPADRWLRTLRGRTDVLAAAFHVDYWDRLGWRDRFASAAATQRQQAQRAHSGSSFIYTPQVLVDGKDWRRWPALPSRAASAAVALEIERDGDRATLRVRPAQAAGTALGLWWALLEDDHDTAVREGENAGAHLRHDHVVRRFGHAQLAAAGGQGTGPLIVHAPRLGEGGRPTRLLVVVHDAASGRTLQAAQLACGPTS